MNKLLKMDDTLSNLNVKLIGIRTLLDAIAGEFYIGEKEKRETLIRIDAQYEHFTNLFGMVFDYTADARQILTEALTQLDDIRKPE